MKDLNLGKTPILKLFISYAIPSVIVIITQMIAGLVDSFFVGRYIGSKALSSIALLVPVTTLLMGIGVMVAIGGTTITGIYLGQNENNKANNSFNITLFITLATGLISSFILYFFITDFADLLGAEGIIKDNTVAYGKNLAIFITFFLTNFTLIYFLKLDEKPTIIMVVSLLGVVINIVLDYIFIKHLNLGVAGAALATGISQTVPSIILFIVIVFNSRFKPALPLFSKKAVGEILFNGSSELLSMVSMSISSFVFNIVILNYIGVSALSAYAVVIQIYSIAQGLAYGIAESPQAAISFNYGAMELNRVKSLRRLSINVNLVLGLIVAITTYFLGEDLARIFIVEPDIIKLSGEIIKPISFGILLMGINISVGTYYTAVNDPILSGSVTLLRGLVGLVAGIILLPLMFGLNGVWWSILFAEILTITLCLYLIKKNPFGLKFNINKNSKIC